MNLYAVFLSERALHQSHYIFPLLFSIEFPAHTKGVSAAGRFSKTDDIDVRLGLGSIYLPWHFKETWFVCTNLAVIRCKDLDRSMQAWCIGKQFTCKITSPDNSTSFGRSVIMLSGASWFVYNMHAIKICLRWEAEVVGFGEQVLALDFIYNAVLAFLYVQGPFKALFNFVNKWSEEVRDNASVGFYYGFQMPGNV